ncbi:hypothetical protein CTAYLR_004912 [Chrysophaeum taylorii]|uniref:Cilium assembly protein DZIP1 N-terminal domain-containing protein n=1 Tax=Chrysophaeum taylorii TaxID=2483200 RepID=A0AAD7UPJ5_9STRA|nr:hypothetical protein CTAYLR_004912 [Chrysophaeum taylorii]
MGFAFERFEAPVNWPRVASTNVTHLERTHNHRRVLDFLADVTVGDVDDGFLDASKAQLKALRYLQLSVQYLLHSQHALKSQNDAFETGLRRLAKREAAEKKRCTKRRSQLAVLRDESDRLSDILSTYHTTLEAIDPDLAASLAQDHDGRVVVHPADHPDLAASRDRDGRVVVHPADHLVTVRRNIPARSTFDDDSTSDDDDDDDDDDVDSPPKHGMRRLRLDRPQP